MLARELSSQGIARGVTGKLEEVAGENWGGDTVKSAKRWLLFKRKRGNGQNRIGEGNPSYSRKRKLSKSTTLPI